MPLPNSDDSRYVHKSGGGAASLFGLPFFLVGLGVITAATTNLFSDSHTGIPFFFGLPFGSIFAGVGGVILLGRAGLEIDRSSGEIVKWWGLLVPMKRSTYSIKDAKQVSLSHEIRRNKNSSYSVYPVRLELQGHQTIDVETPRNDLHARKLAEQLAKFLRLPLSDSSQGAATVRDFDELDLNVKQRFRQGRIKNDIPATPAKLVSKIDFDGLQLRVTIPPSGFRLGPGIAVIGLICFCAFASSMVFIPIAKSDQDLPFFVWIFMAAFLAVPGTLLLRILSSMFLSTQSLEANSQTVKYTRGWILTRTTELPCEQIEEIRIGRTSPGTAIGSSTRLLVRTDEKTISASTYLSHEEANYILALLQAVVIA